MGERAGPDEGGAEARNQQSEPEQHHEGRGAAAAPLGRRKLWRIRLVARHRRPRMALTISITPPAPMNRPSAIKDPMSDGKLLSESAIPPNMSAQRPGRSRMIPAMIIKA